MANTPNINLEKPIGTDHALVSVINSNSDKIDNFAGNTNQAIANLGSDVDSLETRVVNRIQYASMANTFSVQLPRSSWVCGLLIVNTNGGGNGVYYCEITAQGTFAYQKVVANQGNNQTISGTQNGTTLTLEAKMGTSTIRMDYATWIGLS